MIRSSETLIRDAWTWALSLDSVRQIPQPLAEAAASPADLAQAGRITAAFLAATARFVASICQPGVLNLARLAAPGGGRRKPRITLSVSVSPALGQVRVHWHPAADGRPGAERLSSLRTTDFLRVPRTAANRNHGATTLVSFRLPVLASQGHPWAEGTPVRAFEQGMAQMLEAIGALCKVQPWDWYRFDAEGRCYPQPAEERVATWLGRRHAQARLEVRAIEERLASMLSRLGFDSPEQARALCEEAEQYGLRPSRLHYERTGRRSTRMDYEALEQADAALALAQVQARLAQEAMAAASSGASASRRERKENPGRPQPPASAVRATWCSGLLAA